MKNIPPHWKKVKFKELAKEKSVRVDNPGESGYDIYVGLEHLDSGELVVKRYGSTSDVTSAMKLFSKNDILFARRNTYLRRVSVAPFDGVCSGDIIVLEPILEHIVEGFLPIFMQFEDFENRIIALSAGAFSKRIKWKQLAEEEVVIPSIEEQQMIVKIVWSIQTNIQSNEKVILTTGELKKEMISHLLTKGIWDKKLISTELGEVCENFKLKELGELVDIKGRIGWRGLTTEDYVDDGAILLGVRNITRDCKLDLTDLTYIPINKYEESPEIMVKPGDILFAKTGATTGKSCVVNEIYKPTTVNAAVNVIRCNKEINNFFLNYYISSNICQKQIWELASESARPNLFQRDIKKIKIILPSLEEQKKIVNKLVSVDTHLDLQYKNLLSLYDLRKRISNELLSGRIRIPEEALRNVQ